MAKNEEIINAMREELGSLKNIISNYLEHIISIMERDKDTSKEVDSPKIYEKEILQGRYEHLKKIVNSDTEKLYSLEKKNSIETDPLLLHKYKAEIEKTKESIKPFMQEIKDIEEKLNLDKS